MKSMLFAALSLGGAFAHASDLSVMTLLAAESQNIETYAAEANAEVPLPNPGAPPGGAVPAPSNGTRMETLASWYSQGSALTFAQFQGFYSGRCFYAHKQNDPVNTLLGYIDLKKGDDNAGPGFPAGHDYRIAAIVSADVNVNFDSPDNFSNNKTSWINITTPLLNKFSVVHESPTLSYSFDWEPNGNPDENHQFVTYNSYIVEKWSAMFPQKYGDLGFKKPGETLGMCYYFKKLE